jgi:hypothetical protein
MKTCGALRWRGRELRPVPSGLGAPASRTSTPPPPPAPLAWKSPPSPSTGAPHPPAGSRSDPGDSDRQPRPAPPPGPGSAPLAMSPRPPQASPPLLGDTHHFRVRLGQQLQVAAPVRIGQPACWAASRTGPASCARASGLRTTRATRAEAQARCVRGPPCGLRSPTLQPGSQSRLPPRGDRSRPLTSRAAPGKGAGSRPSSSMLGSATSCFSPGLLETPIKGLEVSHAGRLLGFRHAVTPPKFGGRSTTSLSVHLSQSLYTSPSPHPNHAGGEFRKR